MIASNSMHGLKFRVKRRHVLYIIASQFATVLAISTIVAPLGGGWRLFSQEFLIGLLFANCIGWLQVLVWTRIWFHAVRLKPAARGTFFLVVNLTTVYVGTFLTLAVLAAVGWFPWAQYWTRFWQRYFLPMTVITIIGTLVALVAISLYESWKYRSQYETAQARLSSLESRLQPHFLFNTLNSIWALIPEDPAAAERMVLRLSGLLRFSLDATHGSTVRLEHELNVTRDYLEIEKTRFGPRLQYSIDVPPDLMQAEVPPFSLQTLVENSVKYGGGEIRVSARNGNGRLVLNVWDSGAGFPRRATMMEGHGLHNLQSRLAVLWGSNATLEFPQERSGTNVQISLPIDNGNE